MTKKLETRANHVVEAIHIFINEKATTTVLPPTIYVQFDNCTRENKNRCMFSCLASLVAWRIFEEIEASFLPVAQTHEDIDQAFSRTSERLRSEDSVTLAEFHGALKRAYNGCVHVVHIKSTVNWSGLYNQERALQRVPLF